MGTLKRFFSTYNKIVMPFLVNANFLKMISKLVSRRISKVVGKISNGNRFSLSIELCLFRK